VIRSYRDLRKAASYLQWQLNQASLRRTVENYFLHLGAPLPKFKAVSSPLEAARRMLTGLKAVEQAFLAVDSFNHLLAARQLPTLEAQNIHSETLSFLAGLTDVARSRAIQQQLFQAARQLTQAGTHPITTDLQASIQEGNHGRYQALMKQYQELREQVMQAESLYQRANKWSDSLPQSIKALTLGDIPEDLSVEDLRQDLFRIELEEKLSIYLAELEEVQTLLSEVKQARLEREQVTAELAAERAWQARRKALTEDQLSSLAAWRNDLINVGKGFGKNTARHLASARQNLKNVQGALPVWIMQQDVVTRLFDQPEPGQFDLLIIDEASQCDISALNLVFRAKKSVIVGDENQTSVSTHAQQFPIERTNQILDRYLIHHPYKQQFNLNNRTASIYSLSGVVYPNVITLREHFRCVPEIIGFSNQEVYHHKIQSLRTPKSGRWGQATEIHYLEDDPKKSLKPQLAKQTALAIRGMIEDYELGHMAALPTVGVICLESSNEAHLEALTKELGRDPKLKAYRDQLQLRVGTARHFQGDERDLIILTTTANHSRTAKGKLKPPRAVLGEDMMRIYNVAVSRARDKVILLHSILPEAIPLMNPDCYRKRLIDWMTQGESQLYAPTGVKQASVQPGEDLLAEVYSFFAAAGFTELQSNFQVAGRNLDLAIWHGNGPKGLIIDGPDQPQVLPLADQALLERTGWDLYRLPSTLWHLRPEEVKAGLRAWLS
ncbi:MAG: AAA domain-containing protein, partial [Bacteroidota bacterium]